MFDGLPQAESRIPLGKHIRFFGDGFQKSKVVDQDRYWRIPVMDGEFLIADTVGVAKGVAGGNIILQANTLPNALEGARRGVAALENVAGVIAPFPRRCRTQRKQGRIEIFSIASLHSRRLLPHATRSGQSRSCARESTVL